MKIFAVVMITVGMLCSGAAMAVTGTELSEQCQALIKDPTPPSKYFASGVCAGYINGMIDGIHIAKVLSPDRVDVCFPDDGFTSFQAVKVVQRYLDTHPEKLNEDAMVLTSIAFKQAFPCQ
ncbi:Rap1a/Tai family immunity protein [Pseudomonas amygdali]